MEAIEQIAMGLFIAAAFGFVLIAFGSAILHYFVALNSPPSRRAFWTVAPAYLGVALMAGFGDGDAPFPFWVWPIGAILPAAIAYWFWMNDFEKRWYDGIEDLPDDVPLANHDWKNGLLQLAALMVLGVIVTFVRHGFAI